MLEGSPSVIFQQKLLLTMNADFQLETLMAANDKKIARYKSIIRAEPWYLMESSILKIVRFRQLEVHIKKETH